MKAGEKLNTYYSLGSVVGSMIQDTGRTEFEDVLRRGNQSEAVNITLPKINVTIDLRLLGEQGSSRSKPNSNLPKFHAFSGT